MEHTSELLKSPTIHKSTKQNIINPREPVTPQKPFCCHPKIIIITIVHKALLKFFGSESKIYIPLCLELLNHDSGNFVVPKFDGKDKKLTLKENLPRNLVLHVVTTGDNMVFVYQAVGDNGSLTSPYLLNPTSGDLPCKTESITQDETTIMGSIQNLFSLNGMVNKDAFYWNKGEDQTGSFFKIFSTEKLQTNELDSETKLYWQSTGGVVKLGDYSASALKFQLDFKDSNSYI